MSEATGASAALLLLAAAALLKPSRAESAYRRLPRPPAAPARIPRARGSRRRRWAHRAPTGASALVSAAAGMLIGGPLGLAVAPAAFFACRRLLRRLTQHAVSGPQMPMNAFATELLAACLDAGATPAAALAASGGQATGPLAAHLLQAAGALGDGATAEEALPEDGPLALVSSVFRRSSQTGSAMSEQLIGIAAQLRADEQYERLAKAHRVGVLSALPLGLCMLPAFLLLAVVPAVIGLGAGLLP